MEICVALLLLLLLVLFGLCCVSSCFTTALGTISTVDVGVGCCCCCCCSLFKAIADDDNDDDVGEEEEAVAILIAAAAVVVGGGIELEAASSFAIFANDMLLLLDISFY